jgi:hypothetical protein
MGRLLLAIDGGMPHQWTIRYTVQLCKSLRAQLHVLCVGAPGGADCTDRLASQFESHSIACQVEKRVGNPTTEIVNYLNAHHEIVLAIYDLSDCIGVPGIRITRTLPKSLLQAVRVPMVTVRPQRGLYKILSRGIKEVTRMAKIFSFFKRKAPATNEASESAADSVARQAAERPAKLVVVGQESRFSESIISYALDMARRMDYQILALNTAPLSCETFRMFSTSRAQVCQDFEVLSEKSALGFRERAEAAGIDFTHVVKFVETDEALAQLKAEFDDIGFIVSEPEEQPARPQYLTDQPQLEAPIRVYSVI